MSPSEAAEELGVSRSFCPLSFRGVFRDEQSLSVKPRGGNRPPAPPGADLTKLRQLVRGQPDATLREVCQLLKARRGVRVRTWTVCRALKKPRLPPEKSARTTASGTRLVFAACAGRTPANWSERPAESVFTLMKPGQRRA